MSDTVPLLTAPADLTALCADIRAAGIFGLDTEFVTERTYRPELSLVQVALPERVVLVDALAVDTVEPVWELVADPAVPVVMHGAEQEARFCWHATGRLPGALFDIQLAAAFTGLRYPMNYASLVQAVLRVRARQGQTRTDWTRRPLSGAQLAYAAEDVAHLLPVHSQLTSRLAERGRLAWLEEETRTRLAAVERDIQQPRWWRVSGAQGLSRRALAALREIWFWREGLAERRNMPRKRVLRDDLIVSAATSMPRGEDELRRLRGFEKRNERDVRDVLRCIRRARELPDEELPESRRARGAQPLARMLALLMEAVLDETCADQEIDTSLVGTASDLRELARWHQDGAPPDARPALMSGWRASVCGDILEAVLAGSVTVSVRDPASERPLRIQRRPESGDGAVD